MAKRALGVAFLKLQPEGKHLLPLNIGQKTEDALGGGELLFGQGCVIHLLIVYGGIACVDFNHIMQQEQFYDMQGINTHSVLGKREGE